MTDPEMPSLVDPPAAGPVGGGGRGYIPPPPGATYEPPGGYNPFPGAPPANYAWPPPATAPAWAMQGQVSPSPWANDRQYPRYGSWSPYPYSPYHPTPAASYGGFSPVSRGIPTPGGGAGAQEITLGQPITASPYFNGGAANGNLYAGWPDNAGPERRRKPSFGGPGPGPGPGRNWLESVPLQRTHSQDPPYLHTPGFDVGFGGGSPSMRSPLMRSLSTGAVNRAKYFYPEEYGTDNLARRPKDWRPDYRRTFIPRIQRPRSDVEEYKDPTKRVVHPTLSYNPSEPCVSYDLRFFPHPDSLIFPPLGRPYNHIDFAQLATNPPADRMRLFHPALPWYIDIVQSQANGITVEDVFMQVFSELQLQITARHYYNDRLGSKTRESIARAFVNRTRDSEEREKGIKRVDYFEDRVIFVGLVRTRDGLWEMKTKEYSA